MTTRLQKGAIVGIDLFNPLASVVVFQYNPKEMTRSVKPRVTGGEGAKGEAYRLAGPPEETISLKIDFDAADQLERGEGSMGVYPQLSALEMLVYPKSALVIANTVLLALGTIEVIPPAGPFTLFIWGPKRVVPVRLTQLSITEEEYDSSLNPIRAKADVSLQVLSYHDLPITHLGYGVFLAHQVVKEAMAVVGSANNLSSLGSTLF